jgi:hypothetical protein
VWQGRRGDRLPQNFLRYHSLKSPILTGASLDKAGASHPLPFETGRDYLVRLEAMAIKRERVKSSQATNLRAIPLGKDNSSFGKIPGDLE